MNTTKTLILISSLLILSFTTFLYASTSEQKRLIDSRFKELEKGQYMHSFARLEDGKIIQLHHKGTRISKDNGKTWGPVEPITIKNEEGPLPTSGSLVLTRDGVLVIVYPDLKTFKFSWQDAKGEPAPDNNLDIWAIRSTDMGKTWTDRQIILDGYCGAFQPMIETKSGHLVVPLQNMITNPGRNVTFTMVSDDNGKTWTRSNIIDLGGNGHHDGVFESCIIELKDGRLWMLLRTNWGRFWEAFSDDHGYSWRTIRPSKIESSTSPGYLLRLNSGRIALIWNQLYPEGQDWFPPYGDRTYSSVAASWHREEISIAFSEDEGKTWTKPIIFAREKSQGTRDARLAYPYAYEFEPGLIHIRLGQGMLFLSVKENQLIR